MRLYLLEEIKNKPFYLRVTVMSKVNSEDEGRSLLKSFTSLRIMLSQMDRKEETIGNMSMLSRVRPQSERTHSFQGLTGVKALDELQEISEEDSFADGIESVKGDIDQTENGSGVEVAKNVQEEKKGEPKSLAYPEVEEMKQRPIEKIVEDLTTPEVVTEIEHIPDWPQRMEAADYTQEQRYLVELS